MHSGISDSCHLFIIFMPKNCTQIWYDFVPFISTMYTYYKVCRHFCHDAMVKMQPTVSEKNKVARAGKKVEKRVTK
jgi:hypothetical protein